MTKEEAIESIRRREALFLEETRKFNDDMLDRDFEGDTLGVGQRSFYVWLTYITLANHLIKGQLEAASASKNKDETVERKKFIDMICDDFIEAFEENLAMVKKFKDENKA